MLYKIVKITDLSGKNKTDDDAVARIGRIINLDVKDININNRLFMTCVDPGWFKSIVTSFVKGVIQADDGLIITTEHSIYFLIEKEIADRCEEYEYQMNVEMASHFDMDGDPI